MLRFFQIIKYSFYSKEFYQDVFSNLRGYAVKYLIALSIIASIPVIASNQKFFKAMINSENLHLVVSSFPDVKIKNNEMVTEFIEPYKIKNGIQKVAFFSKNNSDVISAIKDRYRLIFTKGVIKVLLGDEYAEFKYSQIFGKGNAEITSADLMQVVDVVKNNFFVFSVLIPAIIIIFIKIIKNIFEFGLLSLIVKILFPKKIGAFNSTFRLLVFVFYPITFIEIFMFSILGLKTIFAEIVFMIVKVGYLIFATKSIEQKNPSR